jgi:hypothetical protein
MTDLDRTAAAGAAPPGSTQPGPPARSPKLIVVLTSVAYFMVALDALAVITALPSIHRDLGGSGARSRLDIPALILISAGVGVLIWALVQGAQEGWGSAPILAALVLGGVLIAAFVAWEACAPEPMIPLRLFRTASFPAAVGAQFLMSATMQQFGAVFGIAIVTAVFNAHGSFATPAAVVHGCRPAVAVSAAFSVLAAAIALGVRRRSAGATMPGT